MWVPLEEWNEFILVSSSKLGAKSCEYSNRIPESVKIKLEKKWDAYFCLKDFSIFLPLLFLMGSYFRSE